MESTLPGWDGLPARSRLGLIVGVAVIVGLAAGGFFWLSSERYAALFTDLEARDAAAVMAELERLKVDFKLANGGTQINVPASAVHEIRLKLTGSGVPLAGGVGFEIFDDADFGMTEFAQRVNYQRALEGELTRTIMSLQEVKYARVHLVLPERGLFEQDDSPPSASVTLFLNEAGQSVRPSERQILGIQRLISAAVPELKAELVTVSDQTGMTLSRQPVDAENIAAISGRLQQKQAFERYLADKVNAVLKRQFGAGHALATVNAELDFNQVQKTLESVVPAAGSGAGNIVRRRETRMDTGAGNPTDSNITTEVEYRHGRSLEQIVEMPGKLLRLTVGVMVPEATSQEQRRVIRELVEVTVGLESARGDQIAVYATGEIAADATPAPAVNPPRALDETPLKEPPAALTAWRSLSTNSVIAVSAGLLLLAILSVLLRRPVPVRASAGELSALEREQLLSDIRLWLDREDPPAIANAGTAERT